MSKEAWIMICYMSNEACQPPGRPTPFADSIFLDCKNAASISSLLLPENSLFRRKDSLFGD
jgi:hypothetical protein